MSNSTQMLNDIYQGAQMGTESISHLIKLAEDIPFRKTLETQLAEYQNLQDSAEKMLKSANQPVEGVGGMAKASSYVMVEMKTLTDKSSAHMAEMMIQGSTMGVIQMTKDIKAYPNADPRVRKLADKMLATEQHNIEEMKRFI